MSSSLVDLHFTTTLPKIELHAHLTGSISRSCLHDIWLQRQARGDLLDLDDPLIAIPSHKVDYDIKTFFPLFSSYIYKLCDHLAAVEFSTEKVLHDFQSDGVVYLELRTTPRSLSNHLASKDQYVDTVLGVMKNHNDNASNTMQAFLILSVDRRNSIAEAEEVVDLAIKYQHSGVVGIDLCGNPAVGDVRIFTQTFSRAKAAGLKLTIHFAEIEASASHVELDTILSWKPNRLGHVIHVNDRFRERIESENIAVELCLSCNVHAKMIDGSYPDHHFGMWRHSSVPVILCTDDVGVFCSPLSQEYHLAAQHFDLDRVQLRALCERAIDSIFGSSEQRSRLCKIYSEWGGW